MLIPLLPQVPLLSLPFQPLIPMLLPLPSPLLLTPPFQRQR